MSFRDNTPCRTDIIITHFSDGFNTLREDFNHRCGYCDISDNYLTVNFFQIDHFKPQKKFGKYAHDYNNLVYACRNCNIFKSDFWATDDPEVAINYDKGIGLYDPCDEEYSKSFFRNNRGCLVARNDSISKFIYRRLKFYLFKRAFYYQLDQIDEKISRILLLDKEKDLLNKVDYQLLMAIRNEIHGYVNDVEMNYKSKA